MRIETTKQEIKAAESKLKRVGGGKNAHVSTHYVLIRGGTDGLTLTTTDATVTMRAQLIGTIPEPGAAAVETKKFFQIVKALKNEAVTISEEEDKPRWIEINDGRSRFNLVGLNPDDFIEPIGWGLPIFQTVDAADLKRRLEDLLKIKTTGAETPVHRVLKIDTAPDRLRIYSTDGSRALISDAPARFGRGLEPGPYLIPKYAARILAQSLTKNGLDGLEIAFSEGYMIARRGTETMTIQTDRETQFPPTIDDLAAIKLEGRIKADRAELKGLLERAEIMTTESYKGSIFIIEPGRLTVRTSNPELGESEEAMEIDYDGPEIEAAFNARFFIEALNIGRSEIADIEISTDDSRPARFPNPADGQTGILMPMRI